MKDKIILLLLLLLTLPTFFKLVRPGYYPMHDDMQAMRLLEMDKCVKDGQVPCRWVPDMGFGYGYPQFNYYAPLPYYVMEVFHLFGSSFLDSVKIGIIIASLLSVWGMYLLGKSMWGRMGGILSALFYAYLPYRAVDTFVRGAMGELWALAILPFIFLTSREIVRGNKKTYIYFVIVFSALLTSHNISVIMTVPFLLLWILFNMYFEKRYSPDKFKKIIKDFTLASIWSLAISAFFVFPAWFEKGYVHLESLTGGYFDYINHFVGLKQLLLSNYWGYGASQIGPFDETLLSIGIWYWTIPLVAFVSFCLLEKWEDSKKTLFLIVMGFFALFMIHPKSEMVWRLVPLMAYFQFPWRFLIVAGLFLSLCVGSLSIFFKSNKYFVINILLSLFILLIIFYGHFFRPKDWLNINDNDKFGGESWIQQQTVSIYDYLPKWASKAPDLPAPSGLIGDKNVKTLESEKGSNWQRYEVQVDVNTAKVMLPVYYFPGWQVKIDGSLVGINYDNTLGLIGVEVGSGKHVIDARLKNTPIRNAANLSTIAGIMGLPVYFKRRKDEA